MKTITLNIYDYTDYRSFLIDFYEKKKQLNETFSFGAWSKYLGMAQTASLTRLVQGKRFPSAESIQRFAEYFSWNKAEE